MLQKTLLFLLFFETLQKTMIGSKIKWGKLLPTTTLHLLSIFVMLSFEGSGLANNIIIDSLKQNLLVSNGTEMVGTMSELCWEYRFVNSDSSLVYGNKALKLARQLNDRKGIAQSLNDLGIVFIDQGNYEHALSDFSEALIIRQSLNDSAGIASLYNKMGIVHQKQGNLKSALRNQMDALEIYEKMGHQRWVSYSLNNIAIINFNIGNLETSLDYHQKALGIRNTLKDEYGIANSLGNIANVLLALQREDEAIKFYSEALEIFRKLDNKEAVSVQLSNLGALYFSRSEYNKALMNLLESLALREELGDKKAIASSMIKIGEVHMEKGDYSKAEYYLGKASTLADEINVSYELIQSYLDLSRLYGIMGEKDSVLKYLNLFASAKDSVYNTRLEEQIIDAQTKYDVERKNKDLQLLKSEAELTDTRLEQRKTEIWLLLFVIISISGTAVFLFYRRKQKQKQALDAAAIFHNEKLVNTVINVQEAERRKIARELHDGIGQTLAGIKINLINTAGLSGNEKPSSTVVGMLDDAADELRSISHQMMPKELEQFGLLPAIKGFLDLRLRNTDIFFSFEHLKMEERLEPGVELGVFRVVQELTANIVKHSGAKLMNVQLLRRNKNLILIVTDDGKGFELKKIKDGGIGLMNIESRVEALKGIVNFVSSPENGTEVTIRIPLYE